MRRRAREAALQVLYQMDVQPDLSAEVALAQFFGALADDSAAGGQAGLAPAGLAELRGFIERLVKGVMEHVGAIDARIAAASRNWRLERMSRVDRNLLRLAVYEMLYCEDVPAKAAINEAIEISKRYGATETPAFVNGILDRVLGARGSG